MVETHIKDLFMFCKECGSPVALRDISRDYDMDKVTKYECLRGHEFISVLHLSLNENKFHRAEITENFILELNKETGYIYFSYSEDENETK